MAVMRSEGSVIIYLKLNNEEEALRENAQKTTALRTFVHLA